MRIVHTLEQAQPERDTVLTIGSFDGVHRGHQHLVRQLVQRARETGRLSMALSFYPHPRAVLHPELRPAYLSTPQERAAILAALELDLLLLLPFTKELAATPAADFMGELVRRLRLRELWVGPDFSLGRGREGDVAALRALGQELGYALHVVEPLMENGEVISSTRIRHLLQEGQVEEAAKLLGRPYSVMGTVIQGAHRGRSLGFRTANLRPDPERALPADGVYVIWASTGNERHGGVANIGVRPSFGTGERLLEAHLLDYSGDLYSQDLLVEFVRFLRPERRFADTAALVEQIRRDIAQARAVLAEIAAQE
jgi:riboflavin kinase/FMN adenylyltransferase